jgi:ribulose-phosphate 3-epimerase
MIHIAPSILSADFARLGEQVAEAERGGAQRVHIDVMDGHFVPNLSMGPVVVAGLRKATALPLEVHLMIEQPDRFIPDFFRKGADSVIFHLEAVPDPRPLVQLIRSLGKKVGLTVKPETPVEALEPYLPLIDLALCMTVHPGFGGQAFLPESPGRIRRLRQLIEQHHPACELEVDGGIEMHTVKIAVEAGANVLVAGTAVFCAPAGPAQAVRNLLAAAGV